MEIVFILTTSRRPEPENTLHHIMLSKQLTKDCKQMRKN